MALGTTANYAITRNDLIAGALRKIKGWPEDGNPPLHKLREAIRALNLIVREEDLKQTTLSRTLWATDSIAVFLSANGYIYGTDEGLSATIREIVKAMYRDVNGEEVALEVISDSSYARLTPKNQTGDPVKVYLKLSRLLADQKLYVWPSKTSVTTPDEVVVSENRYQCVLKHTSASENKPATGASWQLYWQLEEAAGGTADDWVTATEYTSGELIYLHFKRPLFDFDGPYDNPDFPLGWENYLIYKLAVELAPEYGVGLDERAWLSQQLGRHENTLFPSAHNQAGDPHNKAVFF